MDLKTKCKIAKKLKDISFILFGLIGLGELYTISSSANAILADLAALFNKEKMFVQITTGTFWFLGITSILILSLLFYFLSRYLCWKWFCKEIKKRYGNL